MKDNKIHVFKVEKDGKITYKCSHCKKSVRMAIPRRGIIYGIICPFCRKKQRSMAELRSDVRRRFEAKGSIKIDDRNNLKVKIKDISTGGIAFETPFTIETKEVEISFNFHFSKRKNGDATHTIKIVSKNGNKYGAQFVDLVDYSQMKKDIHWWTNETIITVVL
ncbi:MAG: hypothetical protein ACD_7C00041G0005 [uncultured bacterium]|nr:MAG: hypothetical protein ACD_7C00041G0005 [uncultured bacterium]HBR79448.1 hypothetical protein [Candidatus Moranbacteria bacterium]